MSEEKYVSAAVFAEHARNEEHNQKVTNDALHEGNIRMGNIEESIRPLQAIRNMLVGASWIGGAAIALVLYIYMGDQARTQEDRQTLKTMVENVQKQGTAIEKMIQSHAELEKDTTKEFMRMEKTLEAIQSKVGKL